MLSFIDVADLDILVPVTTDAYYIVGIEFICTDIREEMHFNNYSYTRK